MAIYAVRNQWGGKNKPWNDGGTWVLGCRPDQNVINIDMKSANGGKTFSGTMMYEGEGLIGVRATQISGNNYKVENQWGGEGAEWNPGGCWIIGGRDGQSVIELNIHSDNGNLNGTMVYDGEGPIGFESSIHKGFSYTVENQWGGDSADWNLSGTFVLGTRVGQEPVAFDISSSDDGKTFTGTMTYKGEGPIGFKAEQTVGNNNYVVQNQWGGDDAAWNDGGNMVIGARSGQNVVKLNISSSDEGLSFSGDMVYQKEGPIGFKGKISTC